MLKDDISNEKYILEEFKNKIKELFEKYKEKYNENIILKNNNKNEEYRNEIIILQNKNEILKKNIYNIKKELEKLKELNDENKIKEEYFLNMNKEIEQLKNKIFDLETKINQKDEEIKTLKKK